MKRVAIPISNGKLSEYFVSCSHYEIFEVEDSAILKRRFELPPSQNIGELPEWASSKGITDSTLPGNEAGFIKIDGTCKVNGSKNAYAVGDNSAIEGPEWRAKQGHLAVVKGKFSAYNIDQEIKGSTKRKDYIPHVNILCIMDTGNGAAIVYRKGKKDMTIPLPIVGHWLKKAWGSLL